MGSVADSAHSDGDVQARAIGSDGGDVEQIALTQLRSAAIECAWLTGVPLVGSAVDATGEHLSDALATANRKQELVVVRRSPEDNAHLG